MIVMNEMQIMMKTLEAGTIFTPGAPINDKELFAGRIDYVKKVVDTIVRPGLHAIMYGERGVGKTSLANQIHSYLPDGKSFYCLKVNSAAKFNFTELWRDIFRDMDFRIKRMRYLPQEEEVRATVLHFIDQENPVDITPSDVRFVISQMPSLNVVIIIDEFDRMKEDEKTMSHMVDTIKMLSDYGMKVTLILVAVADSVGSLIKEHSSLSRALVQIQLPRMSIQELREIVIKGMQKLSMTVDPVVIDKIVELSQGLPHYTHLLSLEAVISALNDQRESVEPSDLNEAITQALEKTTESTVSTYGKAVNAPRGQLYRPILLGCALAKHDERGFFTPSDVRDALKEHTGEDYELGRFIRHLHQFASPKRGDVLTKEGVKNQFRYRFSDPMMQPYIIFEGIKSGKISRGWENQSTLPLDS